MNKLVYLYLFLEYTLYYYNNKQYEIIFNIGNKCNELTLREQLLNIYNNCIIMLFYNYTHVIKLK